MKLACASGAVHREIESGELTQLEFLDLCARELGCDGVVLDVRHFPRPDDDYLAQIKKMATDWGLSIAALSDSSFFCSEPEHVTKVLSDAALLGAPVIAAPLALQTECSWSEQLERLAFATSLAKRLNVTLALRNAPNTFAAGTQDCKRVVKETDSAWLRYGPDPRGARCRQRPASSRAKHRLTVERAAHTDRANGRRRDARVRSFSRIRRHRRGVGRGNKGPACGRDRFVARRTLRPIQRTQPQIASCVRGTNLHSRRWVRPGRRFRAGISSPPLRRIRS